MMSHLSALHVLFLNKKRYGSLDVSGKLVYNKYMDMNKKNIDFSVKGLKIMLSLVLILCVLGYIFL